MLKPRLCACVFYRITSMLDKRRKCSSANGRELLCDQGCCTLCVKSKLAVLNIWHAYIISENVPQACMGTITRCSLTPHRRRTRSQISRLSTAFLTTFCKLIVKAILLTCDSTDRVKTSSLSACPTLHSPC